MLNFYERNHTLVKRHKSGLLFEYFCKLFDLVSEYP